MEYQQKPYSENPYACQPYGSFSDSMPTLKDFQKGFDQAYADNFVTQQYGGRTYADGVIKKFSEYAGIADRTARRYAEADSYIHQRLHFQTEPVAQLPAFVAGLNTYRQAKGQIAQQFASGLENVVAFRPELSGSVSSIVEAVSDFNLTEAPLQAKLYASVDRILSYNMPLHEARREATANYLTLVAQAAEFNPVQINKIIGNEASTPVPVIFKRAGLNLREISKQAVEQEQDTRLPKAA